MSTKQKSIGLTREPQIKAYLNARAAVMKELGPDATEGEIVKELAKAYTGHGGECDETICGLVSETAAENGDPVYSRNKLESMEITKLRNMAADVETDAISGRDTKLEIIAYFSCPYAVESNPLGRE